VGAHPSTSLRSDRHGTACIWMGVGSVHRPLSTLASIARWILRNGSRPFAVVVVVVVFVVVVFSATTRWSLSLPLLRPAVSSLLVAEEEEEGPSPSPSPSPSSSFHQDGRFQSSKLGAASGMVPAATSRLLSSDKRMPILLRNAAISSLRTCANFTAEWRLMGRSFRGRRAAAAAAASPSPQ